MTSSSAAERSAPGSVARIDRSVRERLRSTDVVRDVVVASGTALVLGLIGLGAPSLWVDEASTARSVERSFPDLVGRQYHILHYLVLKPWVAVAGTSEWALRFPSVVGAMLACGLLVVLAHRLFDRWLPLASGLLLATSPFVVKWSQQARSYTMLLALAVLATLLLLRALERDSRAAWAAYGVAFACVVVWHPVSGVLLVPGHLVLVAQRRERVLPHGLLAAVLVGVLAVPWAAVTAMRSTGEGVAMDWLTFPTVQVAVRGLLDVSGAAGLGVVLGAVGLVMLRRAGRTDLAVWLGVWAFAPFVLALLVSTARPIYLDRYLIVAAPAFALLGAAALDGVGRRLRAAGGLAIAAATVVGLVAWYTSWISGNWRGEDWRGAARLVSERSHESDAVLVVPWSAHAAAEYYGVRVTDVSSADSLWVLTWSETSEEMTAAQRRALGFGGHVLVERIPFGRRVSAELWKRGE